MSIFTELSLLFGLTTIITLVIRFLKQPLIVGYILSGIFAGPYFLNLITSTDELELFSKIGIVFLLFIVGLHLNPKVIKEVGSVSFLVGLGQVVFTSIISYFLLSLLGYDYTTSLYVALAITLSSTIIILKLLADKKDLQSLYAKISVGILIVQDLVASFALIFVTLTSQNNQADLISTLLTTFLQGIILITFLLFITHFVLTPLTKYIAQSQELLFLFSLAWGVGLATVFLILGFSVEIGALVAGVTLSTTPYADEISSRFKPLRDFFIIIFFLLLGHQMNLASFPSLIKPAAILSIFILIGNPLITFIIMNISKFSCRTSFLTGLTVAQISEFSLIFIALGVQVGHLEPQILSLVTLIGLITISASSYLILYGEKIYPHLKNILHLFEIRKISKDPQNTQEDYDSLIFGFDRVGLTFTKALKKTSRQFLVVDYNPTSINRLHHLQIPYRYGDAEDTEFLDELPTQKPKLIISTIPDVTTNSLIIKSMRQKNPKSIIICIAHTTSEAKELYKNEASYVFIPHHLGAEYAARIISKHGTKHLLYKQAREKHLLKLEKNFS